VSTWRSSSFGAKAKIQARSTLQRSIRRNPAVTLEEEGIDWWVSVDEEFLALKGVFVKGELEKELKDLNESLPPNVAKIQAAKNDKGSITKKTLIDAVIEARKKLVEADNEWISKRQAEKRAKAAPETPVEAYSVQRDRALDLPICSLKGTAVRAEYELKKHTFEGTTVRRDENVGSPVDSAQPDESLSSTRSTPSTGGPDRGMGNVSLQTKVQGYVGQIAYLH
jgi:hypothetical protein